MRTSKVKTVGRQEHAPERTCVACRDKTAKRDLVRLVRSGDVVVADPEGRMPGRGVYLCRQRECWETGLKNTRIEFGLRTKITVENRLSLLEYGRTLPGKENR